MAEVADETPSARLRRAADRLDELDRAASQGPWKRYGMAGVASPDGDIVGEWKHHCGCGEEVSILSGGDAEDADLIVALRSIPIPLALWLRWASDHSASGNDIPVGRGVFLEPAIAMAGAVLDSM